MSFPRKPKECHNLEKKSSDKNSGIDIKLVVEKRNLRPYKDQSVDFPDAEAKLYEPGNSLAHGPYDRFKMFMAV